MRKKLEKKNNKRMTFIATFERYGKKTNFKGYKEETLLFLNVCDLAKNKMADHIWFTMNKQFRKIGELKQGDTVQFDARIKGYYKGYNGYKEDVSFEKPVEYDYKLSHPTKIKKIGQQTLPLSILFLPF